MENKALILTDSINTDIVYADGSHPRCTTFDLTFWRALLAEFNTHGQIVRSSASSRAIPFKKMVAKVEEFPFVPMKWQEDHSGMQGNEYFEDEPKSYLKLLWNYAKESAIKHSRSLNEFGLTKQLCNRLLEPFMWHEILATATEYENFFALRASEYAEIHFADLAYKMLEAYNASTPRNLKGGDWHLPFNEFEGPKIYDLVDELYPVQPDSLNWILDRSNELVLKIATARCARKSYQTLGDNPVIDYAKDIKMHDDLAANGHVAPFAHPNRAMTEHTYFINFKEFTIPFEVRDSYIENNSRFIDSGHTEVSGKLGIQSSLRVREYGWCKQFRGFIPYRAMLPNENRVDNRVIRK